MAAIKLCVLGLNRGLSSNHWLRRSANYVQLIGEYEVCKEKHVLRKKDGFVTTSGVETH